MMEEVLWIQEIRGISEIVRESDLRAYARAAGIEAGGEPEV